MAGTASISFPSSFSIGNCIVDVQGSDFICEPLNQSDVEISVPHGGKIKIQVAENGDSTYGDQSFLVINPKDIDSRSKSLLQEVLSIYAKELPAMKYAANTGKKSQFLEKCVSTGKYCTLLLKSKDRDTSRTVIAAVTYQIIPADTQYAEVPLAAVRSNYQQKGIGKLLYSELKKRLQSIGVRTVFCWGDQESKGFWLKQGFVSTAEVDSKGKASGLRMKANIRKALCFPGDSTLMVSHLNKDISTSINPSNDPKQCSRLEVPVNSAASVPLQRQELQSVGECNDILKDGSSLEVALPDLTFPQSENPNPEVLVKGGHTTNNNKFIGSSPRSGSVDCENSSSLNGGENNRENDLVRLADNADKKPCSCSGTGVKRRAWEASLSSLKSKKVKGGHCDCHVDITCDLSLECDRANNSGSTGSSGGKSCSAILKNLPLIHSCQLSHAAESRSANILTDEDCGHKLSTGECHRIMLMDIADDVKKPFLTKIIQDLGGAVVSDGSCATHVVTGKARRTLNFCTALCSGAWIISTSWLKASFRESKFVGELPFVLQDEDYLLKYKSELKDAVLRVKAHPRGLLEGYEVCFAKHVQPPVKTLSAIVKSSGGHVRLRLTEVKNPSKTIFVACEEDTEDAMAAAKKGLMTYNSEWFMTCVMKQELDFQSPQFAESL